MSVIITGRAVKILRNPIKLFCANLCCLNKNLNHSFNTVKACNREVYNLRPLTFIKRTYSKAAATMSRLSEMDPSSFSQPELVLTRHISLNLDLNFEDKIISGHADYTFNLEDDCEAILLDIKDQQIESIETHDGQVLKYTIGDTIPNFGSKLSILLPKPTNKTAVAAGICLRHGRKPRKPQLKEIKLDFGGLAYAPTPCSRIDAEYDPDMMKEESKIPKPKSCECCVCDKRVVPPPIDVFRMVVRIKYQTSPCASALQWLERQQTAGKKFPFLFSQCQPIHARSLLPCQDTPTVKFTYDAIVTAPDNFTVLMSALRLGCADGVTTFKQPVPIPSYLLAIACGVIDSAKLGPRSTVWAERSMISKALAEFEDTEQFLQAAEELCGTYVWEQYDLLVLPPSFPYGGMENPCLTFVTPTLLSGDKSQADVIIHEIMHSWTGNLVTNRNFEHFWLNEGFTVFLERKVAAKLISTTFAEKHRDFFTVMGLKQLNETVFEQLGHKNPLTCLVPDLTGVHPDEAFSLVPYEKGSIFLRYLENLLGGPAIFDEFVRAYILKFQEMSISTLDFKLFLLEYFEGNKALDSIDWDQWLGGPGMPLDKYMPPLDNTLSSPVKELLNDVIIEPASYIQDVVSKEEKYDFNVHQKILLLQELLDRPPLPVEKIKNIGRIFKIAGNPNTEIKYRWIRLGLRAKDESKVSEALDFVSKVGRMKYLRPIYRDLYAWEEMRQRAIDNFLKNEKSMMAVTAFNIRKDMNLGDWASENTCP